MTDKEKQHYVPRFYLKNFSFHNNRKEIGIFNVNTNFFIQNGKLKTQCYKPFFYGKDGKLEDALSELESLMSPIIRQILVTGKLPRLDSEEHHTLLYLMILTEIRNPIASKAVKESQDHLQLRLNELEEEANSDTLSEIPKLSPEEMIKISFSGIEKSFAVTQDLGYKLILNSTDIPFITSDNPLVKYNQYLEQKKAIMGKTGYASIGIQLFLPLDPYKTILFYDGNTYKVGDKKKSHIELTRREDVEQLNLLQILNCERTAYFNHQVTQKYLKILKERSSQYSKGTTTNSKILGRVNDKGEKIENSSIIWLSATNFDINLSISNITLTKKIKTSQFDATKPSIRPRIIPIINQYRH
ncbi:MAG TPA: DUF4238 domain-containing protein [Hanamia sp.]